jgi:hypothetical protein
MFKTANDQAFQIQFRRNAQKEITVQRVMMSDERPGESAAWNRLHHRRFHLQEAHRIEIGAQMLDDSRPGLEHTARFVIHDQVQVALPISKLLISQSMELLRQWPQ